MTSPDAVAEHAQIPNVVAFRLFGERVPMTLSLPEQLAAHIGERIVADRYRPGERLLEQDLSVEFAVSRGPVREALRLLEREGLVQIHARRGARVADLTEQEVRDIFEVRAALFRIVAERLAATRSPAAIARMERGIAEMERYAADPESGAAYAEVTYRLGLEAVREFGNRHLTDIVSSLALKTLRYTRLGLATHKRRQESLVLWRQALDAVRAGDAKRAGDLVEQRIEMSRDEALRQMRAARVPDVA